MEEAIYLGTRTLVMSARPGRIVADVPTPFSRERGDSRQVKSRPDFVAAREPCFATFGSSHKPRECNAARCV